MILIKIGGSLFAPKNNDYFDSLYLEKLYKKLKKYKDKIILVHGTGNVGHGFVNKYGVSKESFLKFIKIRKSFFKKIDNIFLGYKRFLVEEIIYDFKKIINYFGNVIISGDILKKTLKIVSSDIIFGKLILRDINVKIILTDVTGVMDSYGNLINKIDLNNIEQIKFWHKKGDVTNSMKGKILAIKKYIKPGDGVWLCNGFDLENLDNIIKTGKGIGTYLYKGKE